MATLSTKPEIPIGIRPRIDYLYYQIKGRGLTQEEVERNDLTEDFFESLKYRIKYGMLISITIRGETAMGKSTAGIYLKKKINDYLIESKKRECKSKKERNDLEFETIASDQIESNRLFMRDWRNVCILIDEYSTMAQSGENATTEQNLYTSYVDIFAQRFVHRIQCTPRSGSMFDMGATYILNIDAVDKKRGTTLATIFYNDPTSMKGIPFPLGFVKIEVNDLIEEWRKIEDIARKEKKTEKDEGILNISKKKDFYVKYMDKKFKRMDLLDKKGVRDIRELEKAKIILEVYNRCKEGVNGIEKELYGGTIKNELTNYLEETKVLTYSMIGRENVIEDG